MLLYATIVTLPAAGKPLTQPDFQFHDGLLSSGDPAEDSNNREGFAALAKEKLAIDKASED